MFFGESLGIARYDTQKYLAIEKNCETQISQFWRPEEIDLSKDRVDLNMKLLDHERHIFLKNLSYQTMLDSVQGRSPNLAFLPYVTIPELEAAIVAWTFFESIHSRSYTHIIRNALSDPSALFDTILQDAKIVQRAEQTVKYYDEFIEYAKLYSLLGVGEHTLKTNGVSKTVQISTYELKRLLYLALISVYVLESIRFYVSFACSFAFGERGLMEGNAKIISLIARDEAKHLALTQIILTNFKKKENDAEMLAAIEASQAEVYEIFQAAVQQEKEWAAYLFKDGVILGLNEKILGEYVEFLADIRLKNLGMPTLYKVKNNPLTWMDTWLDSKLFQPAPQETELSSYLVGAVDANKTDGISSSFDLGD